MTFIGPYTGEVRKGFTNSSGCIDSSGDRAGYREKRRVVLRSKTYKTKKPWTEQEDQQLRELAKAGKSMKEISEKIGRPTSRVRERAKYLSIAVAKITPRLRSLA